MLHLSLVLMFCSIDIFAVPPDACFARFRWEDCGKAPVAVMYYYKSGSRCEVGLWRGCVPNLNMFKDEYECVQTCIFTARAQPEDYHQIEKEDNTLSPNSEENDECKRRIQNGEDPGEECEKKGTDQPPDAETTGSYDTSIAGEIEKATDVTGTHTTAKAATEALAEGT